MALEATLTAIKGSGWSIQTLKNIFDSIDAYLAEGGSIPEALISIAGTGFIKDTDSLVNIRAYVDEVESLLKDGTYGLSALNVDLDTLLVRLTATRAGYLDNINNAQLLNIPNLSTLTAARIGYLDLLNSYLDHSIADLITRTKGLDEIHDDVGLVATDVNNMQVPIKFPSPIAQNNFSDTNPNDTTELEITVSLPSGASIVKAMLAAFVTAKNGAATAQDIDISVSGRPQGGSWTTLIATLTDCLGLPNVDKATTGDVYMVDATSLITGTGTWGFKTTITLLAAATVRFKTEYLLIITYRMS